MHVVKATPFHRSPRRAANQVRYISHGEKHTPGAERREIYGIGDRYQVFTTTISDLADRQQALERLLLADAETVSKPAFHAHIFTLDHEAAGRFAAMDRPVAEQRLRSIVQATFRSSAFGRQLQGMYAIHWDGGYGRVAHPHVHVVYSPVRADGRPIYVGPVQLEKLKSAWNRSVDRELGKVPNRGRERPSREQARLERPLNMIRGLRDARYLAHNPAHAAVRMAGRTVARVITGRAVPAFERTSGVRIPPAVSLALRLAIGKLSLPREIARAIIRVPFERERERRR